MTIIRNGVEIELTDTELLQANLEFEHNLDCANVRAAIKSGLYDNDTAAHMLDHVDDIANEMRFYMEGGDGVWVETEPLPMSESLRRALNRRYPNVEHKKSASLFCERSAYIIQSTDLERVMRDILDDSSLHIEKENSPAITFFSDAAQCGYDHEQIIQRIETYLGTTLLSMWAEKDGNVYFIEAPDIRRIQLSDVSMPRDEVKKRAHLAEKSFGEYFSDEYVDDDNQE